MSVDLAPDPLAADLAARTAAFVRDVVIPIEVTHDGIAPSEGVRVDLQKAARAAGVFAPHVSAEFGGHGLDMRGRAAVFEEAGFSLLGPLALNIAAPDEGNMHLLEVVASAEQKQRYLVPLAAGEIRSCFAMTEPDNDVRRCAMALIDTLAALHAVDPAGVGLTDFGKPEGFLRRQIRR
jgi:acyl-CoA dehydrogenase